MKQNFKLKSPFKPAGDQPQAIEKLIEGLNDGLSHQTLLGVTGSGKTFTIANIIQNTGRPAIILAPNKTLAAQLYGEMKEFSPENAVEFFVSYYDYYQPKAQKIRQAIFKNSINSDLRKRMARQTVFAMYFCQKKIKMFALCDYSEFKITRIICYQNKTSFDLK